MLTKLMAKCQAIGTEGVAQGHYMVTASEGGGRRHEPMLTSHN